MSIKEGEGEGERVNNRLFGSTEILVVFYHASWLFPSIFIPTNRGAVAHEVKEQTSPQTASVLCILQGWAGKRRSQFCA